MCHSSKLLQPLQCTNRHLDVLLDEDLLAACICSRCQSLYDDLREEGKTNRFRQEATETKPRCGRRRLSGAAMLLRQLQRQGLQPRSPSQEPAQALIGQQRRSHGRTHPPFAVREGRIRPQQKTYLHHRTERYACGFAQAQEVGSQVIQGYFGPNGPQVLQPLPGHRCGKLPAQKRRSFATRALHLLGAPATWPIRQRGLGTMSWAR